MLFLSKWEEDEIPGQVYGKAGNCKIKHFIELNG
jgi:hypothetical protein